MFDEALLRTLWPHGDSKVTGLIAGTAAAAPGVFPKYGITSDRVVAHAMAQFSEECGRGTEMQENMNYSAARLLQVFPTHFSQAQAIAMQHNPRLIADQAYNGRMGNRRGSDDGWNFRGQGFSQLTGHDNYDMVSRMVGLDPARYPDFHRDFAKLPRLEFNSKYPVLMDLVAHPEFIVSPARALEIAVADFVYCGCLPYALKDDLVGVSSMLNVGHYVSDPHKINGFALRQHELALWKHAMKVAG